MNDDDRAKQRRTPALLTLLGGQANRRNEHLQNKETKWIKVVRRKKKESQLDASLRTITEEKQDCNRKLSFKMKDAIDLTEDAAQLTRL